jgi:hypothetical protein
VQSDTENEIQEKKYLLSFLFWFFIVAGLGIRIFYFAHTPIGVRAHDFAAHAQYIRYVSEHFRVPPAAEGFEYFQAPAYYFLAAALLPTPKHIGPLILSMFGSCLAFMIAAASSTVLWKRSELLYRALFVGLIGGLPGLIYFGAGVNNDSLLLPLSFLFQDQMVRFWLTRERVNWWLGQLSIAVGVLTKSSAILYLPLAFITLFAARCSTLKERLRLTLGSLLLQGLVWGWYAYFRVFVDHQNQLVGNTFMLFPNLQVANGASNLLFFNPFDLLSKPYNNPWHDDFGRQFFWQFFFKSFFVGEYQFSDALIPLTVVIELLGFLLLAIAFKQIFVDFVRRTVFAPMILSLFMLLGAVWFRRMLEPYACNQDFRFVPLVAVPLSYYCVSAIKNSPPQFKFIGIGLLFLFIGSCGALSVLICKDEWLNI